MTVASLTLSADASARDGLWQRTKAARDARQREAWRAAERTLNGKSDELDLLRVRTALVDLSRGALFDPRAVLSLLELRRQLGLPAPRNGPALLANALSRPMERYDRARAYLLSAQMLLQRSTTETDAGPLERRLREKQAAEHLQIATRLAWERQLRARILVVRSLVDLARGEAEQATALAFSAAQLVDDARQRIQVQTALALGHAALGRISVARESAVSVSRLEAQRREASGLDVLADLPLSEGERDLTRDALAWLAGSRRGPLDAAERRSCTSLLERPGHPRFQHVRPEFEYALRALLEAACPGGATHPAAN